MVFLLDSLSDLSLAIGEYITQALKVLLDAFFHPILYIFAGLSNIINLIFNAFTNLFSTFWNTYNIIHNFESNILTSFFPNIWTTLILLALTIVFLLRLYYFIKDIEILGNKI